MLLAELFHSQSKRWVPFARSHLDRIAKTLASFVQLAVTHLEPSEHLSRVMMEHINGLLSRHIDTAAHEPHKLCADIDEPPLTYNHYYTYNVQKERDHSTKRTFDEAFKTGRSLAGFKWGSGGTHAVLPDKMLAALKSHVTVDMEKQACSEALIGLRAYYKVACKTFVDNVCVQVIERHLLRNLAKVFSPDFVAGMSDEELQRVAGEHEDTISQRENLQELLQALKTSLLELRKL